MKTKKQVHKDLRPKHKLTKNYLKHYYPFIPLFVSLGFLLTVLIAPKFSNRSVLSAVSNITPEDLLMASNNERIKNNVEPLKLNNLLNQAAQTKAHDMVVRNYWAHKTPDNQEPWVFIDNTNYSYQKAGENLAYGFENSSSTVTGWMNSQSHRENLLDKSFTEVGFGVANSLDFVKNGPETVVVAFYAQPANTQQNSATAGTLNGGASLGESKSVSNIGLFTGSSWGVYAVGIVIGMCLMYIASVHGSRLKKTIKKGERFIIKHPLLDSAVIALIAFGIILLRSAGFIL